MKTVEIELYSEVCCEECNEVVHNHMDKCPVCSRDYAGTSCYSDFNNNWYFEDNSVSFRCEHCNTNFTVVSAPDGYYWGKVVVEYSEPKELT